MDRDEALSRIRRLRPQLEARGIVHAALFGSVSRGTQNAESDVDIVVAFAPSKQYHLFDMGGVQSIFDENFGGIQVDVEFEPIKRDSLRAAIERDRTVAF